MPVKHLVENVRDIALVGHRAAGKTSLADALLFEAHAVDRMGSEKAVAISSTLLFLYCIGAITGPLIASSMMVRWGDPMLFVHNAAVHALMAAFVFWRIMVRAPAVRIAAPEDAEQRPPAAI